MDVTIMDSITNVRTLKHAHSEATVAGTPIVVNGHVLIPVNSKDADTDNTYVYWGKVRFAKAAALAIDPGEVCYWDAADKNINKDGVGNTPAGICVEAAAADDTTVIVMLLPNIELVDAGEIRLADGKIMIGGATGIAAAQTPSGDVTMTNAGVMTIGAKKVTAAKTAIADGKIFIGGADGAAAEKTLSGDITMTNEGVTAIGAGKVTAAMLANGAGLAAAITAGLGASANYAKTTDGAQTLAADDASDRVVLGIVTVTEVFADGDGGQTVFTIGETDTANKFMADTVLASAAAGSIFFFAGTLTAAKDLLVTGTPATGTGTGAISVSVLMLPAAA